MEMEILRVNLGSDLRGVTFALADRTKGLVQMTLVDGQRGKSIMDDEAMLYDVVSLLTRGAAWDCAHFYDLGLGDEPVAIVKGPGPCPTIEELISPKMKLLSGAAVTRLDDYRAKHDLRMIGVRSVTGRLHLLLARLKKGNGILPGRSSNPVTEAYKNGMREGMDQAAGMIQRLIEESER